MFEEVLKVLYFYVAVMSFGGIVLFLKQNFKAGMEFLTLLLLCLLSRRLIFFQSSRYYSIFIFVGVFFSAYLVKHFANIHKSIYAQIVFFVLLFVSLLYFHIDKCFSGFRNSYVFDLQDMVEHITYSEPSNNIFLYEKEFGRVGKDFQRSNNHLKPFFPSIEYDFSYFYIRNGDFKDSMYLICPNEYIVPFTGDSTSFYVKDGLLLYSKIEHHYSNAKHNQSISVYKHFPYAPSPSIDVSSILISPVLKVFIPEYETYVYQSQNKIVWFIGTDLETGTEVIYHIFTDQPELLPPHRKETKFDNWGFRFEEKYERNRIGKYHIFESSLPTSYHITFITVGFSFQDESKSLWRAFTL